MSEQETTEPTTEVTVCNVDGCLLHGIPHKHKNGESICSSCQQGLVVNGPDLQAQNTQLAGRLRERSKLAHYCVASGHDVPYEDCSEEPCKTDRETVDA